MNAILQRELVGILRTRKAFALQFGMAAMFTALIVLRWPSDAHVDHTGVAAQGVFRLFIYGLLAAVILLVPIFPATTIVAERRRGTLALLFNSPLHPATIYFGKLIGVMSFALLLLAVSLPAAAACYAMGGISLRGQLAPLYGLFVLLALEYAALAMFVSSRAGSPDSAVRVTYAAVLGAAVASLGPHFFLQGGTDMAAQVAAWLRCLSPIPPVMQLLGHGDVGAVEASSSEVVWRFVAATLLATLVCIVATLVRMNHRIFDRARSAGRVTDERGLGVRAARRVFFLIDPQRRSSGIGRFTNPVLVKEFRTRRFGRSHWMMRLMGICAIASLFLAFSVTTGAVRWEMETVGGPLVLLQATLVVVIMPSLAAGQFSSEQEAGTWVLLRTTPLSPGRIVRGKLLSSLWTLVLILSATLPGYAVMIYIQPTLWLQTAHALVCLALSGVFALTLSAAVGSLFRRTAAATAAAYVAVMTIFVGTILIWMGRDAPFGHELVETALVANSLAAALSVFNVPGFESYDLTPANWWFMGIASAALFALLCVQVWRMTKPA